MLNWLINLFQKKSAVPTVQEESPAQLNQAAITLKKHDIKVEHKQTNKIKPDNVKSSGGTNTKSKVEDPVSILNPIHPLSPLNPVNYTPDYGSSSSSSCSDYSSSSSSSSSNSCD